MSAANKLPKILVVEKDDACVRLEFEIEPELHWFRGHFPDQPVLPGVVQLHWAVLAAREYFGFEALPVEIKRLKFMKIVTPPRTMELVLTQEGQEQVQFEFHSQDDRNSQGRLVFAGDGK